MEATDYISRDVSWLFFNHRVLQEAKDPSVPLYERIKFLAIYSSNLDEFFRVRVSSLRSFKALKKETRKALELKPKKQLKQIRKIVEQQQREYGRIFREEILPALKQQGIHLIGEAEYDESQRAFARQYFNENLADRVAPIFLEPEQEQYPFLKNRGLYFIVHFQDSTRLALVDIPSEDFPRFITLPKRGEQHFVTFLDDVIRMNLSTLLDEPLKGAYSIKLSRDADLRIEDEFSGDLVEKIKAGLQERNIGLPTRFLYDSAMPEALLDQIKDYFHFTKNDLIPGARYHNFNDFFSFPNPTNHSHLHDPPLPPLPHPELEQAASIMQAVRERDRILHFPYQRYDYVPRWIWQAAEDPQVEFIKLTLYRVASKSAVVQGLLYALEKGKMVTAFIEAKARFDEASNLFWGEELQKAGAKVLYSYPEIKVHTKLLLIGRREEERIHHYAYLGTGNFNEKTARLYCDHALLSADPRLTDEVAQIFFLLERKIILPKCRHLLVAPFSLREGFESLVEREIENARAGKEAYMILKMNSLEDKEMVHKLYEAGRAGVRIQLIIRGICSLVPEIEGQSDRIEARSILDRFLEHARVYIFANGGEEKMYLASADWMTRNLDRRVEVAMPVYHPRTFGEIRHIINLQLQDNTKARRIEPGMENPYVGHSPDAPIVRAQIDTYRFLEQQLAATNVTAPDAKAIDQKQTP